MIVAIGLDVDDTYIHFVEHALNAGVPLRTLNLRAAVEGDWRFEIPARRPAHFRFGGESLEIQPSDSFYCRMIDLAAQEEDPALARRWHALLGGLRCWLESAPGRVVNRMDGAAHNSSKPLHEAVLSELGFRVPESVTTCDPDELRRFVREGAAISKTVCGVRAEATVAQESDFEDFEPASGPVHVQRRITGADARIHVVGDRLVAQRVSSDKADYRRGGTMDELEVFDPPPALRSLLIEAGRRVGLAFSGWDFKIDAEETYWCLEVNPMPGYSSYDARCDGAISDALLDYLGTGAEKP